MEQASVSTKAKEGTEPPLFALLTSAGLCWGCFTSLWWLVLFWSWTLWQQCQTGGCCPGCGFSCSMALTLSTTLWSNRGAPSVRDSLLLNAPLSTTGSHSCLWPLNSTTPPSKNRTNYYLNKHTIIYSFTLNFHCYLQCECWIVIVIVIVGCNCGYSPLGDVHFLLLFNFFVLLYFVYLFVYLFVYNLVFSSMLVGYLFLCFCCMERLERQFPPGDQ